MNLQRADDCAIHHAKKAAATSELDLNIAGLSIVRRMFCKYLHLDSDSLRLNVRTHVNEVFANDGHFRASKARANERPSRGQW